MSQYSAEIGTDVRRAAELLRAGELVAVPTETVYGLAANALDAKAVTRIFEVKNRPRFNPLILHGVSPDRLRPFVREWPEVAQRLVDAFWPGPLTLLLPRSERVPDIVTAGSDLVAIRLPRHPLTASLLRNLDFPLAAPSANPSGYISPTTAQHVAQQLGSKIPYILDGGPTPVGIESTIVGFDADGTPRLYRSGGVPLEALERIGGKVRWSESDQPNDPASPGRLKSHYAPKTPLYLGKLSALRSQFAEQDAALLTFETLPVEYRRDRLEVLSETGDLAEAAQGLFAALRRLDDSGAEVILAELLPEKGIGRAINDRLRRAAADSPRRS